MSVRETQIVGEVVTGGPGTVRATQIVAEAVTSGPGMLRATQLVAEVVLDQIPAPVVSSKIIVFSSGD